MTSAPDPTRRRPGTAASGTGSPTSSDADAVALLLGRAPFTRYRVAVRCPFGGPAVLENDPVDVAGRPFPTRYWLCCRSLGAAVSRVEAAGGVRELEADGGLRSALAEVHAAHAALHGGHRVGGVGGDDRVKCLHAQLAYALATGGNAVGDWIAARVGDPWPDRCCVAGLREEGA